MMTEQESMASARSAGILYLSSPISAPPPVVVRLSTRRSSFRARASSVEDWSSPHGKRDMRSGLLQVFDNKPVKDDLAAVVSKVDNPFCKGEDPVCMVYRKAF